LAYQYETQLTGKADEFIRKLEQAGFSAKIIPGSMREYNLKIGVSKDNQPHETVLLFYSPKKDCFSPKYHEMKNRAFEPELEAIWQGRALPPSSAVQATNDDIEIYVDGSFQVEANAIGYGVVIVQNEQVVKELLGQPPTTEEPSLLESYQIAGEIYGVRAAIEWCQKNNVEKVTIAYDYTGLEMWATGEWQAKKPLSQEYVEFIQNCGVNITWQKVAAHTGQRWNERADILARQATSTGKTPEESPPDPISAMTHKAGQFVESLQTRGITATFEGVYNNQYARLVIFEQDQKIGVCDLYNTKKRSLSDPYWHDFITPDRQQEFKILWREFETGNQSSNLPVLVPPSHLSEVDYYYHILKPYADCAFDFGDLAQAIARSLVNLPTPLAGFDPETARYNFQTLEAAYYTLKETSHV
jgi:ribonuclease HI